MTPMNKAAPILLLRKPSRRPLCRGTARALIAALLASALPQPVSATPAPAPAGMGHASAPVVAAPAPVASAVPMPTPTLFERATSRQVGGETGAPNTLTRAGAGAFTVPVAAVPFATGASAAAAQPARQHTFPAGWSLVSVPLLPSDPAPSAVFASVPAPLRLYDYVGGQSLGMGEPGFRPIAPGRVDWLLLTNATNVSVSGSLVTQASEYRLPLIPGWNGLATPWISAVGWDDSRVSIRNGASTLALSAAVAQGWIDAEIHEALSPDDGYAEFAPGATALAPWQGYLLHSAIAGEVIFSAPPPDTTAPTASIAFPLDGSKVTGPVEVVGTADDANLASWILEYEHGRNGQFTPFASGTNSVVDGSLATFDPTLLKNGLFVIRLTVTDVAGRTATAQVSVIVKDNFKVGNFTVSFVDLEVPVSGIPIRITRTYDSRDRVRGDFGAGWTLDVSTVRVETRDSLGLGWTQTSSGGSFPQYCLQSTQAHPLAVVMADGRTYEFDPVLSPSCQNFAPLTATHVSFVARAGSPATLEPIDGGDVDVVGAGAGPVQLFSQTTFDLFDPLRYAFARSDQRRFQIHRDSGLESVSDRNGNTLSVSPAGIVYSSSADPTASLGVAFARDAGGRITAITDPLGAALQYGYDGSGDLVSFKDREQNETTFTYHPELPHYLQEIKDALGRTPIRNEYDESGRLISHTDAFGKTIEYTHDIAGRRESVRDRNGNTRVLEYDERGNVVRETDPDGRVTERSFDERNNRLTETDALLHTTTYSYDERDNVLMVEDPQSNQTEYTYDAGDRVLTTKDARGKTTTNTYDAAGNLLTTEDPQGNVTTYSYDAGGNVKTQAVSVGGVTQTSRYDYNKYGHLFRETDAAGHETTYGLTQNGIRLSQTTTRTLPGGAIQTLTASYEYDRNGKLTKTTDPDGSVTRTVYDALGKQVESHDKLNHKTAYEYDDLGRLIKTTYPDLSFDETSYDNEGRRLTSTDRGGHTTGFEYDSLGRLTKTTAPDLSFTTNTYDHAGRLVATSDARGKTTSYEYDSAGRRTKLRDPLLNETTFGYDANGNQTTVTDAKAKTTTYVYDDLNRRVRTIFPDTTFTETGYDELGRRVSEKDQAGKTTQFRYDALSRLAKVIDADGKQTVYDYDELGNRTSQTDANGHTTRFEYDKLGRETKRTLPDGKFETKAYDAAGNLQTRTDFIGRTTTYGYDITNRLTSRNYANASENVGFTYTATGRRQTVTDARGATSYGYDVRERLQTLTYPDGRKLTYGYDGSGRRTSLEARIGASALTTGYSYDDAGRLDVVTDPLGRAYDHGYDANGNRSSLSYPNGATTSYSYDDLNRLKTLTTTAPTGTVQGYSFTLGPTGNRERIDEVDGSVRTYGYDNLYRLTSETVTGLLSYSKSFSYDNVGNRLQQTTSGTGSAGTPTAPGTVGYTYDDRDRLLADATTYTYDDNGNLTSKAGEATYTWDTENRLTRVQKLDGSIIQTSYDADGNRVRTTTTLAGQPSVTVDYLVDTSGGLSQVVAESSAAGVAAYYLRGDDLLSVIRGSGTRFYHADGLGSIRKLTDETGGITDSYSYSAFGELLGHSGTDPQPYAFAGEPYDPNVGFQYHRARWLSLGVGRFLGMDPWEGDPFEPRTLHKYSYAGSDPLNLMDPTGQEFTAVQMVAVGALIGILAAQLVPAGSLRERLGFTVLGAALGALGGAVYAGASLGAIVVTSTGGSAWVLPPLFRGRLIDRGLGSNLPFNYPVIDRWLNNIATSIKSLDLGAKTYQNLPTLSRTLTGYIDAVANWQGRNAPWGWAPAIPGALIRGRELLLAIPQGIGTLAQLQAINQAHAYAATQGVQLTIVYVH